MTPPFLQALDRALQAMQAAYASATLYTRDHAAVKAHEARVIDTLEPLLRERERLSLVLLENKVLVDDMALPSGARLLEGFLGPLRRAGVELVCFLRGLEHAEIHALLGELIGVPGHRQAPRASRHIHLGFIEGLSGPRGVISTDSGEVHRLLGDLSLTTSIQSIEHAWEQLRSGGSEATAGVDTLGETVASICAVVGISRSSLLPLAELKRHDEYTFVHTYNVSLMSAALAGTIGLSADMIYDIGLAAMMHDLGKQHVPLEVLNKPGALSEQELQLMRQHPVDGAKMLMEQAEAPPIAVAVAFEHHMNIDGTGYPAQPKGWKISLASQIVHIADVFDALQTHRPYRQAMPFAEAITIMQRGAGVWVDAALLDNFVHRVAMRTPSRSEPESLSIETPPAQAA
jgi:HD-GYP domain-containing protein (c-di-GMP phosphodiesterase class II)